MQPLLSESVTQHQCKRLMSPRASCGVVEFWEASEVSALCMYPCLDCLPEGLGRVAQCFSAGDSTELEGRRHIACPTQSWGYVELLGVANRLQGKVLQDGGYE